MDTYELAELMMLSPAERATLNCVKVRGQTRGAHHTACHDWRSAVHKVMIDRKMATLLLLELPSHSAWCCSERAPLPSK